MTSDIISPHFLVSSYSVTRHLSTERNPCKQDLAWKEDDCKLDKVRTDSHSLHLFSCFLLQLTESLRRQFNCSVPWLRHLTPDLGICLQNTRQVSGTSSVLTLHISYRAAEFYYQNKFPAYTECSQPCQAMEVEAKFKTKSETCNSQITFMFPRDIQKTEEFYSTTPLSLGRTFQFK